MSPPPTDAHRPPAGAADELWDLENLARARRLCAWMFEQFAPFVRGEVIEVGAGIGTFSHELLARGAESLLLIEPAEVCAEALRARFGADPRVEVAAELLPDSPALRERARRADFLLCQNVLEHIPDEEAAVAAMAAALRPGGRLTILVPAHPRLYNCLDRRYGHERRYSRERLARIVGGAGLELSALYSFNLLGVPGWWVNSLRSAPGITPGSLRAYEALVRAWAPIERRVRLPWGLSLIAHARA
ncbi:MAG: class I SAM-dependent methyltransferase [Actinomycetota bacterium]|nr:class I SAM-dependent methyltransferase [Actinomycetota bacterium]